MRRFLFGLVCTGVSLVLLGKVIDWRRALSALETADPLFIAGAVTCLVFSISAKTLRWRFLLPADSPIRTSRLYRILHISFLLNNVLPARLGDVARVAMTSRQPGVRLGHVVSSLITERVTDTVTLLTCFVLVSPFLPIPDGYTSWLHTAWYVLASIAGAAVLLALLRKQVARVTERVHVPMPAGDRLRAEAGSFGDGLRQLANRGRVIPIWGTSVVAWLGAFAINWLLLRALNIDVPVTVAVLLTCTTNVAMLIPSSPGYIGVFHAAATLSLVPFDVDAARALSFAIVAHLVNVLPVSILGATFLLVGRESLNVDMKGWRKQQAESAAASGPN